jgi:hypothetical protein
MVDKNNAVPNIYGKRSPAQYRDSKDIETPGNSYLSTRRVTIGPIMTVRARIGSRTVAAATFLWRRRRRRTEPAVWDCGGATTHVGSPTIVQYHTGGGAASQLGGWVARSFTTTKSWTTTGSSTSTGSSSSQPSDVEENDSIAAAPETPLGIFRLLNDSERQLLQLQRQLTDDAVRCVAKRERTCPL